MLNFLKDYEGKIIYLGKEYTYDELIKVFDESKGTIDIFLKPDKKDAKTADLGANKPMYRITVKSYMTKKATPDFDFMSKWNNNIPMPLCIMTGTIEKETRGMVYMKLHGEMYAEKMTVCMRCGRPLTNPVSQYFGIGPECGNHNYVNPFDSEEELRAAVDNYKKELLNITWEGWVVKSAILEKVEV